MARMESSVQIGPLSKRSRYNLQHTQERLGRCADDIKRQPVEPKAYTGFLWALVADFAIDVSSLARLSTCSRWHRQHQQLFLGQAKKMYEYIHYKTAESNQRNLLLGPAFLQWFGELDTSSQTLRSILSIVPLPSLPRQLDPFVARIVGGWSKLFSLPRRPITQTMQARILSKSNSIQPDEVDAGVTLFTDETGWALMFRFKVEGREPRCYSLHSFQPIVLWETSEILHSDVDDRGLWFPFSAPTVGSRSLSSLITKTNSWLGTLAQHGAVETIIGGKVLQVVLCPRSAD